MNSRAGCWRDDDGEPHEGAVYNLYLYTVISIFFILQVIVRYGIRSRLSVKSFASVHLATTTDTVSVMIHSSVSWHRQSPWLTTPVGNTQEITNTRMEVGTRLSILVAMFIQAYLAFTL